jgi:hypothetical protein
MGVMPSVGSNGDAYDTAMAAGFFATIGREVTDRRRCKTQAEARRRSSDSARLGD